MDNLHLYDQQRQPAYRCFYFGCFNLQPGQLQVHIVLEFNYQHLAVPILVSHDLKPYCDTIHRQFQVEQLVHKQLYALEHLNMPKN